MIKYNNNTINDWNFGDDNIIKVYKHGAVCYYKITSGDTPTPVQEPCFAVVDDITQYQDTEFEDVFNKADGKWYKLNNLNQYEEYGVYASGRTSCEGSTSRLPQGYTEVEYIENTSTAYINTNLILLENIGDSFEIKVKTYFTPYGNDFEYLFGTEQASAPYTGIQLRYYQRNLQYSSDSNVVWTHIDNGDGTSGVTASCSSINATNGGNPLTLFCGLWSTGPWRFGRGKIYSFKVTKNDTLVRDLVPCKRDSDNKYGMYDLITDTFYLSPNNVDFSGGEPIAPTDCVTTYNGKLTIDDGYEYEWNGSSWVYLGEVSGSTIIIKSPEYIEKTSSFRSGYIDLDYVLKDNSMFQLKVKPTNNGGSIVFGQQNATADNNDYRIFWASGRLYYDYGSDRKYGSQALNNTYEYEVGNYYVKNLATSATVLTGTTKSGAATSMTRKIGMWSTNTSSNDYAQIFYVKIYEGNTLIMDLIPWTDMNGNYGMFDKLSLTTYRSTNALTASTVINDVEVGGGYEYPLEYVVREDPPNNLSFSSMTEAEEYECPWVGMTATIAGDRYIFSGDSQSGYEWVYNPSRLPQGYTEVEYIQNTGTSYFDTDFKPNTNTRIVADMQQVMANDFPRLFGCNNWNATAGMNVDYESGYLQISWFGKTSWTRITSIPNNFDRHVYDLNKNNLYVDETLVASTTYSSSYQSSDNLGIFIEITGGRPGQAAYFTQEAFKGKMYSFKVYDNGTLVRDLVPCIKDSDNTVGAYDIVNDVFYTVPTGYTTDKLVAGDPV